MRTLILIALVLCATAAHAELALQPNDRIHVSPDGEHLILVHKNTATLVHRDSPDVPLWKVDPFPATGLVSWPDSPGAGTVILKVSRDSDEITYSQIPFPEHATDLLLVSNDIRHAAHIRKWFGKRFNHYEVIIVGDHATHRHSAERLPDDMDDPGWTTDPSAVHDGWQFDGQFFPWVRLYDDNRLWLHITRNDGTAETLEYDLLTAELIRHDKSEPSRQAALNRLWDAYGMYALGGVIALLLLSHLFRRRNPGHS